MKITIEDVIALSRGNSTKARIGSHSVPHRLQQHERVKLKVAQQRGYLRLSGRERPNLLNIYEKWCASRGTLALVHHRLEEKETLRLTVPCSVEGTPLIDDAASMLTKIKRLLSQSGVSFRWQKNNSFQIEIIASRQEELAVLREFLCDALFSK